MRFAKEPRHPDYDYKVVTPEFDFKMKDGVWFGMKLVSYNVPGKSGEVQHVLYIDTTPFDSSKAVTWGGCQNSIRTDGMNELDFALIGVRDIQPPG